MNQGYFIYNRLIVEKKKKTNVVFIDDDRMLVEAMISFAFPDKQVDVYYNPEEFLEQLALYTENPDILFCIDNNFNNSSTKGVDVAKKLHEIGMTKLYLLSGEDFNFHHLPEYLTVILKTDLDRIEQLGKLC